MQPIELPYIPLKEVDIYISLEVSKLMLLFQDDLIPGHYVLQSKSGLFMYSKPK